MTTALWPILRPLDETDPWFMRSGTETQERLRRTRAKPVELGPTVRRQRFEIPAHPGEFVYAHLDMLGLELYVGKTKHPSDRCANHQSRSPWWPKVRTIVWERQANSDAAYWREDEVIAMLLPEYNTAGTLRPRRLRSGSASHSARRDAMRTADAKRSFNGPA